jgi:amino acid transporter
MTTDSVPTDAAGVPRTGAAVIAARLRRELGQLGTLSISIGVMAPTLAMSITGIGPAGLIGRAAPLAYLFAALGVGLVAYGFVRLSGEVASAGSVYAFVGHAVGERAGFVAGWALLGTYLVFPAVSIAAIAVFGRAFMATTGIAHDAPWIYPALFGWLVVAVVASREVRTAARSLLAFELASVALILVLMAIIVIKLLTGDAPAGQTVNADWLSLPAGTSLSTVALAATAGFLSFAGFESAGSFGEEATSPTRRIPPAIVTAIVFGGVFYVACVAVQTLGFGTDAAGVAAFASSPAPLGELAQTYVGRGMADALDLAAIVSAIGAGVGCASVCGRMLFALAREGRLPAPLAGVSGATGAPIAGLALVLGFDLTALVVFYAAGSAPMDVFFYLATIGVLSLLTMYAMTNVAAARHFARTGRRRETLFPVAGLAVALYVLYHNVRPVPPSPFDVFPYLVAAWLALGIALSVLQRRGAGDAARSPG